MKLLHHTEGHYIMRFITITIVKLHETRVETNKQKLLVVFLETYLNGRVHR